MGEKIKVLSMGRILKTNFEISDFEGGLLNHMARFSLIFPRQRGVRTPNLGGIKRVLG